MTPPQRAAWTLAIALVAIATAAVVGLVAAGVLPVAALLGG